MITYLFRNINAFSRGQGKSPSAGEAAPAEADRPIALPVLPPAARLGFFLKRLPLTALGAALIFHLAVLLGAAGAGLVFSRLNPPFTSLMLERLLEGGVPPRPVRFVSFDRLPAFVPAMYVKLEDKNFYTHHGVDPAAILNAHARNKLLGRVIMGGSTITQQTVRSLLLSPDKNYLRKYVEAAAAVAWEAVMDKKRILELYLNYIEWGKGVYGLGAAAKYYFNRPPEKLSYEELSRLAAIICNPLDYGVLDLFTHPAMAARYRVLNPPPPTGEALFEPAANEESAGQEAESASVPPVEPSDAEAIDGTAPSL